MKSTVVHSPPGWEPSLTLVDYEDSSESDIPTHMTLSNVNYESSYENYLSTQLNYVHMFPSFLPFSLNRILKIKSTFGHNPPA